MINPATQQVNPCPICGSRNVRWRARRWYDRIFTLVAYLVNALSLSGLSSRRQYGGDGIDVAAGVREQVVQDRTGLKTARCFWRCPDCGNSGAIFDEPPPDLALHQ